MDEALRAGWMSAEEEHRVSEEIGRERQRLRNFIRRRVADESDVDDILQEVFYELIESYRLMKPVETSSSRTSGKAAVSRSWPRKRAR